MAQCREGGLCVSAESRVGGLSLTGGGLLGQPYAARAQPVRLETQSPRCKVPSSRAAMGRDRKLPSKGAAGAGARQAALQGPDPDVGVGLCPGLAGDAHSAGR